MRRAAMNRWQWAVRLLTRRVWFRAALFCAFAIALALAGALVGPLLSTGLAIKIGSRSVDSLLHVLAASMLTVTTFSLTVMVSAYWGAMSGITPRAVQLLSEDPTSQNALSTFLGSFLFAVVGIIALSTDLYGDTGRTILYTGTILVVLAITVTFLHWIQHISQFGLMPDTIARVERAAVEAVGRMALAPMTGVPPVREPPPGARMIHQGQIGRVTYIDVQELGRVAERIDAVVTVLALPGASVDPARAIAWTTGPLGDECEQRIRGAFSVSDTRSFDHDPRFGLIVLGEIASRALSPAVNDPGTAIRVIEAGTRVLAAALRREEQEGPTLPAGVVVPAWAFADMLQDLFRPIARDGAALVEVMIRLQKALAVLASLAPAATSELHTMAQSALGRARGAMASQQDKDAVAGCVMRQDQVVRRFDAVGGTAGEAGHLDA